MTSEQKRNCFVVGPIGSDESQTRIDADFLLQGIIRDALGNLDPQLHIWRADEDSRPGMITDKVIADINDSDLVIADLTELNPNVFYELGIRHAAAKPTIHMAAVGTKLPFDNFGHRVIFFDKRNWDNIVEARRRLRSQALEALADGFEVSNPVTQALSAKAFRASASTEEKIISDLMKRLAFLEIRFRKIRKYKTPEPQATLLFPTRLIELSVKSTIEFQILKKSLRDYRPKVDFRSMLLRFFPRIIPTYTITAKY